MPPADRRRVLVVAYYFPPAGGPGVQRVLKTVKYLGQYGWQPTVLTVADGAFPAFDPTLEDDVPDDVRVIRARSLDPISAYGRLTGRRGGVAVPLGSVRRGRRPADRVATWVRANVFLPDARVGWVPFASAAAARAHKAAPFDAVLTSGPPHSTHLAGRRLARRFGLPWIADFRDPWTGINFYHQLPMTAAARALDRRLEASVLRRVTAITTVSPTWARELAARGGRPAADVTVVHNGFDAADFTEAVRDPAESPVFTLAHVGSLYGSRDPAALWEALAHLRRAGRLDSFRLVLAGGIDDDIRASAAAAGVGDIVEATGYLDHAAAVRTMREASALLLVVEGFGLDRGMITGKLYEYLAAGRPIIGLGPADGDAADLLRETRGGQMFDRHDAGTLAGHLDALIGEWESGRLRPGADPDLAAPYTREAQTAVLARVLDRAVGRE